MVLIWLMWGIAGRNEKGKRKIQKSAALGGDPGALGGGARAGAGRGRSLPIRHAETCGSIALLRAPLGPVLSICFHESVRVYRNLHLSVLKL